MVATHLGNSYISESDKLFIFLSYKLKHIVQYYSSMCMYTYYYTLYHDETYISKFSYLPTYSHVFGDQDHFDIKM